MTRDQIIAALKEAEPMLRAEKVRGLSLYGSRARGDGDESSDVDLLVDYAPAAAISLTDFCRLQRLLGERLGLEVQLTKSPVRRAGLRSAIEADAVRVI